MQSCTKPSIWSCTPSSLTNITPIPHNQVGRINWSPPIGYIKLDTTNWRHWSAGNQPAGRLNTLRPRQNGHHFPDDIFKWIFLNQNIWISLKIPLKFVPRGPINNIPALVQIMAWRRPGDKPLSEPMLVFVPTHICVTRPQWVNPLCSSGDIIQWLSARLQ